MNGRELIEQRIAVAKQLPQPAAFRVITLGVRPSALSSQQLDAGLGVDDRRRDDGGDRLVMLGERRSRGSLETQRALPARTHSACRNHDAWTEQRCRRGVGRLQVLLAPGVRACIRTRMQRQDRVAVTQQRRDLEVERIDRELENAGDRRRVLIRAE